MKSVSVELQRHKPQNINNTHKAGLHVQDKIALAITTAVGTMYAVYFFTLCLAGWMLWQGAIAKHPFDPYPFAFLLFMGNIVQLLLMPLIMVGQNIQSKHAELRADEEYQTTLTSYHDLEAILRHLDAQDQQLLRQTKLIEELMQKKS
ncbi:MAG TPA: DUF1003 domain-containing protein [Candidatus Saccharimonadales bacterium]|nr:DUF1003 domain-containing protein [Candidatus Saccharimonadales bacterium]